MATDAPPFGGQPLRVRSVADCPACGGAAAETVYRPDETAYRRFRILSETRYGGWMDGWEAVLSLTVRRCPRCGHFWHADQPDPAHLKGMYDARAAMRAGRTKANAPLETAARSQMRRLRRLIGGERRPELLDYGAGAGLWTRAAIAEGFDAVGYEPSGARSAGDTPHVSDPADIPARDWNAVNLEQVLEHVPDPLEALRDIRRICRPYTVVRISVPDVGRAARRPDFWDSFPFEAGAHLMSPYEHLHGFTGASLRHLVMRAGFREIPLMRTATTFTAYAMRRCLAMIDAGRRPTFVIAVPSQQDPS
jgi:SAM-dependent methyltransferase